MNVRNVGKPLDVIQAFKHVKEILRGNPTNVRNVGWPTDITVPYKDTKALALEGSPDYKEGGLAYTERSQLLNNAK